MIMDLFTDTQMQDLDSEEQCAKAIGHTLNHICRDEYVGWYLGLGTQTFSLLTEALATLLKMDVADVRKKFAPRNARNPKEDAQ